jgi:class 3 adenylate cyclase
MSNDSELSREELQGLLEIAGELAMQSDQELLVQTILQRACAATGSPDGSVLLYDPVHQGLYFAAAFGAKGPELMQKWGEQSSQRVPMESNAGRAFTARQINFESAAGADPEHYKGVDQQTGNRSNSIISVPLLIGEKSIGVLQVLNKTCAEGQPAAYDQHDATLLLRLGELAATALNHSQLVRKLTAQMGLYARDSADDLVQRLEKPAEREQLTVMFADLRGFTQLCQLQASDPERTQSIMNDLLTMYADRVLSRGGIVNKFIGDAVFAIFRGKDAPVRAVRSAFDMLERFDSLRRLWAELCNEDVSFLDLGIGISTGTVAFGAFGSGMVRDFTAIGTIVNLANSLEFAARNGRRVLVDNATWNCVRNIVEQYDDPEPFEVVKAGQLIARYRHVHLLQLIPDRPARVFISHSHEDREFVEKFITGPLATQGIETWYSNADIIPGQDYVRKIEAGLLRCDWVLVLVTENSATSDWVSDEVNTAMADKRFDERILPLTKGVTNLPKLGSGFGRLESIDLSTVTDIGKFLKDFFSRREVELRAASRATK